MQLHSVTVNFIVGISEDCDQNGDRVSNRDKSCHIFSMRVNGVLVKYEKYGLCLYVTSLKRS